MIILLPSVYYTVEPWSFQIVYRNRYIVCLKLPLNPLFFRQTINLDARLRRRAAHALNDIMTKYRNNW